MSHNLFVVSAGTTGRCIYSNQIGFPHIRLYNSGAASVYIKNTSMSSGSSESSGFQIASSSYSHEFQLYPGDSLHVYTTAATCAVQCHIWGDCTGGTGPVTS
jgi:hypothetical protein